MWEPNVVAAQVEPYVTDYGIDTVSREGDISAKRARTYESATPYLSLFLFIIDLNFRWLRRILTPEPHLDHPRYQIHARNECVRQTAKGLQPGDSVAALEIHRRVWRTVCAIRSVAQDHSQGSSGREVVQEGLGTHADLYIWRRAVY